MKKKVKTEAESLKGKLDDVVKNELRYLSLPSYKFNVGDEVSYGRWEKVVVEEVLYNGLIYKIHCYGMNTNYGKPIPQEDVLYQAWVWIRQLRTSAEDKAVAVLSNNKAIDVNYSNRDIGSLLGTHYRSGVDYEAKYQRPYVWSQSDKEALIESIMNGSDIGKFVFIRLPYAKDRPCYECLDGKQRMLTIISFFENRFQYRGKYYDDLSFTDKRVFKGKSVNWGEPYRTLTDAEKLDYFLRLNVSGCPQDPDHIKNVKKMLEGTLNGKTEYEELQKVARS